MPSKTGPSRFFQVARSQGLGVLCGQLTVLLLAVGSVVISATRDGVSANLRLDDIRPFFTEASWTHSWFYLLLVVLSLLGLNTLLCTWDGTIRRLRLGQRSLWHHGPALIHVGLLVALLAHLMGGIYGQEHRPAIISSSWAPLGDGRQAKVERLQLERFPNGQLRQATAHLMVRDKSGAETQTTVEYNKPLSTFGGAHLWLLVAQDTKLVARLSMGDKRCSAGQRRLCQLGSERLFVAGIYPKGHWGNHPVAKLILSRGSNHHSFFLKAKEVHTLPGGRQIRVDAIENAPEIVLRSRSAPGNPWALLASILMILGCILMGRRWIQN